MGVVDVCHLLINWFRILKSTVRKLLAFVVDPYNSLLIHLWTWLQYETSDLQVGAEVCRA